MRILFWSGTFWLKIGGVEVLAARFLPALKNRGHEFVVLTEQLNPDLPEVDQFQGIPVYRIPFRFAGLERNIERVAEQRQQIARLKRTFSPDLVHIDFVSAAHYFHLFTANVNPVPTLITLHVDWKAEQDSFFRQILGSADWVTSCSETTLKRAREIAPRIISTSSVIHNGIDATPLRPQPLPFYPPQLLCLGRLVPEKGFDSALRAFS
jgi:glycosyltransferase involved in cell wall biosynthesis